MIVRAHRRAEDGVTRAREIGDQRRGWSALDVLGFTVLFSIVAWGIGCAAKGPSTFAVSAGGYGTAFESAREVLRDRRFPIERVDFDQGVITTAGKPSSGYATPWDLDQTTLSQEFSDLVNHQNRRVRVTFENADGSPTLNPNTETRGRVDVVVYRMQDYSMRPASRALLYSTRSTDPTLSAQGIYPQYEVPSQADSRLADRLARQIEREMERRIAKTDDLTQEEGVR